MKWNKLIFLSCLMILLLFCIKTPVIADTTDIFLKGLDHYYQENFAEANNNFAKVLGDNETDHGLTIDSLYFQTLSHIELSNIKEAKSNIEKLDKYGFQFGLLHWQLGTLYLNKKRQFDSPIYEEAHKQLLKASQLGIDSPLFHKDLALTYQGLGQYEKAIQEFNLSLTSDSSDGEYVNLASLNEKIGKIENAINCYQKALKIDSENISAYLNLGKIYLNQERYQKAITTFKQGTEVRPSFEAIRFELARTYYLKGDFDEASQQFQKVVEINQNNYRAYYYLGQIYSNKDSTQFAINYYNEAIKYNPDYADAYIALGDIYLQQENYYQAIARYSTAIDKNNTYAKGHYHLALAYNKLGMKEAAIAELRRTIHLQSSHKEAQELLNKITNIEQ